MRAVPEPGVEAAIRDLEIRTLAPLSSDLTRLVYLSSTRDYNTGQYQHEGLTMRFGAPAAQQALAECHEAVFQNVLYCSLPNLVSQLAAYIESTGEDRQTVLQSWRQLQAYRVLVPNTADGLSMDLFVSNIRIALEALGIGAEAHPAH